MIRDDNRVIQVGAQTAQRPALRDREICCSGRPTVVAVVAELFVGLGSLVWLLTVVVFTIGFGAVLLAGTAKVATNAALWPEARVPRAHGNGVVHGTGGAHEREAQRHQIGHGDAGGLVGPGVRHDQVYEKVVPGVSSPVPVFAMDRSADSGMTAIVTLALLFGAIPIHHRRRHARGIEDRGCAPYAVGTSER